MNPNVVRAALVYVSLGIVLAAAWAHLPTIVKMTMRAKNPVRNSGSRIDSRNADGAASAPEFYPPLRLLKSDELCGRCLNPAHQVGVLDRAGLCRTCAPIVASFRGHQQGSFAIAVRVLPFERRHA